MSLNEYLKGIPVVFKHKNGYTEIAEMTEAGLICPNGKLCEYGDMEVSHFKMATTELLNGACMLMLECDN